MSQTEWKQKLTYTVDNIKKKRGRVIAFILIISLLYGTGGIQEWISPVRAYSLFIDNNVDSDSNVDGIANIGTLTGDYTNAQSKDGSWENITEENVGGTINIEYLHGVSGNNDNITDTNTPSDSGTYSLWTNWNTSDDTYNTLTEGSGAANYQEDTHDQITNTQNPADIGIYSNDGDMQTKDGTDNTLTEAQGAGYESGVSKFWKTWGYKKRFEINSDKVAGAGSHTNFTVLVSLASDSDLASNAQSDAGDIAFYTGGSQLDHEIDYFNPTTGELYAWVRMPSLSTSSNTTLIMYYGNTTISNQWDKDNTWEEEYKAVWHLGEDDFTDSSGNSHTLTNEGSDDTTGQIDGARDFVEASLDNMYANDHDDFSFGDGTVDQAFTISAWIEPSDDGDWNQLLGKYFGGREYGLSRHSEDRLYIVLYSQGGSANYLRVLGGSTDVNSGGGKRLFHITYDGSGDYTNLEIYLDGALDTPYDINDEGGTYVAMSNYTTNFFVGDTGGDTANFDGMIDEVRVIKKELTANWISTEYQNQGNVTYFYDISAEITAEEIYLASVGQTQAPPEVGTHSDWTEMQDTDGTDNTLTEAQGSGYAAQVNVSDTFDDYTDIDSYPNVGTNGTASNAQAITNDGSYMTMTESNEGVAGGATEYIAESFTGVAEWVDEANAYDGDWGTSSYNIDYSNGDDYPSATAAGFDSAYSGAGTITQVDIIVRMSYSSSSPSDEWGITLDVGASTDNVLYAMTKAAYVLNNNTFTDVTEPNGGGWLWPEVWSLEVHLDGEKVGGSDNDGFYVYEFAVRVTVAGSTDYELDLEYQFTSADNDNTYEYICFYVQTATVNGDYLQAWEWTGSDWSSIGDLTSDTWNNFTISYLTSATYYIKFNDSDQADETTQSTWNMDCIFLRTSSNLINDYELELEFAFSELAYDETNEELCIFTGTIGDEELDILVWTGSWTDIGTNILITNDDTWVNISISAWLDAGVEYFVFRGTSESGDGTQSTFGIDSVLIHSWSAGVDDYEFDREFAFDGLPTTRNNEYLCIYLGTVGTEPLNISIWDSAAWVTFDLGIIDANDDSWINISISSYLDASTEYFRFVDNDQSNEGTQNTWEIDYVCVTTYDTNYLFDREASFNSIGNFGQENEFLCIETGTITGTETLNIDVWNSTSSAWENVGDITSGESGQWNNMSIIDYLDGNNITFRFKGNTETDDSEEGIWNIDALVIHVWPETFWLDGWGFRKNVSINSANGADINYNVRILGYYGEGTDGVNNTADPSYAYLYFNEKCRTDYQDIRFTDDDGTSLLSYWTEENEISTSTRHFEDNGISQPLSGQHLNEPLALFRANCTWFMWGGGDSSPDPFIKYYNHTSDEWSVTVQVADGPITEDDHGVPSFTINSSGYIHVFYGGFSSQGYEIQQAVSDNPYNISSFTIESDDPTDGTGGSTYPQVVTAGSNMWLFFNDHFGAGTTHSVRRMVKSTNGGETWGSPVTLIDFGDQFVSYAGGQVRKSGDKIFLTFTNYNYTEAKFGGRYLAYMDISDNNMYNITGTNLGIISLSEAVTYCTVNNVLYTGALSAAMQLDTNDNIHILFQNGTGENVQGQNYYDIYYIRWNETTDIWEGLQSITVTDDVRTTHDFIFYAEDNITAYLIINGTTSGLSARGGNLEEWQWNGASWSKTQTILNESSSGRPLFHPVVPRNYTSDSLTKVRVYFSQLNTAVWTADLKLYAFNGTGFNTNETGGTQGYGKWWVQVTDNLTESNTGIWVYYGNSEAVDVGNGSDTFILWDDFDDYSVNEAPKAARGWDIYSGDPVAIANPSGTGMTMRVEYNVTFADRLVLLWGDVANLTEFELHFDWYTPSLIGEPGGNGYYTFFEGQNIDDARVFDCRKGGAGVFFNFYNGSYYDFDPDMNFDASTWYEESWRFDLIYDDDGFWILRDEIDHFAHDSLRNPYTEGLSGFQWSCLGAAPNNVMYLDNVYLRKWLNTEPIFGSWSLESGSARDFQLEHEHQALSLDLNKDTYEVTVYAYSSGGDSEDFMIRMWNATSSLWGSSIGTISFALGEQWFNFSFDGGFVEQDGTATWQYYDTIRTPDSVVSTLYIDYAGVSAWNYTIDLLETTMDNTDYKQGTGWEAYDSVPFTINITSGVTYDVQVKGEDGVNNPVTNEYLRFDTDSDPAGGTNVTTAYQTVWTGQTAGDQVQLTFYLFLAVPFGVDDGSDSTFIIRFRIIEA